MTKPSKYQIDNILKDIQDRLDRKQSSSQVALKVDAESSRCEDDWLYVVVTPTKNGVRAYDYVKMLDEVEKDLRASHIENVLLVPAIED